MLDNPEPMSSPISSPIQQEIKPGPLARFNSLAVVAFALALTSSLAVPSVIIAHFALVETKRRGERGKGLAITALVLGYLQVVLAILISMFLSAFLSQAIDDLQQQFSDLQQRFEQFSQLRDQLNS